MKFTNIKSVLTKDLKAFKMIGDLSNINLDNKAINSIGDYAIMQGINGGIFMFDLEDSVTTRPEKSSNKALPMSEVCFIKLQDGGVYWRTCAAWIEGVGEIKELVYVDIENRVGKTLDGGVYEFASWYTQEELNDNLGVGHIKFDDTFGISCKVFDNKIVSDCASYYDRGTSEFNRRLKKIEKFNDSQKGL